MIFYQVVVTLLLIVVLIPILWFAKESFEEGFTPLTILCVTLSIIILIGMFCTWYYGIQPSDSNAKLHIMPKTSGLPPVMYY